jgi:long-chain acyl-CoA synthetase
MKTMIEILRHNAKHYPAKTALIYEESKVSYHQLNEHANRLANFLIHSGLRKGDRAGLLLRKTPELIVSFLGTQAAGVIPFPIDSNQTIHHIQELIDLTQPAVLIVDSHFQELFSQLRIPASDNRVIMVGSRKKARYGSWEEIVHSGNATEPGVKINGNDVAYFNLTSGTTGIPKCAVTTHDNIYWNTLSAVESLDLSHEDIHLCMFPPFGHPHEFVARPIYLGGTIVLLDNISPKAIVKAIEDHHVTCLMAIASIYETLVRFREAHHFDLKSLKLPESGGMHLNPTLAKKFQEQFNKSIIPVWGSTEAAGIALAAPVKGMIKPGSMGKSCPYYEIKIIDENGKKMPENEIGEMAIKGPAVCATYYGSPEETARYLRDGWFHTADMVKKDSDGYFYFASRKTGMMKTAGLKVFPTEIEDILSAHPKIAEVAVVKGQDGLHGEVPKAVVVPKEGMQIDKSEIRKFCAGKLSSYKVPRIIEFRTQLPKTPGGKILWQKL